MMDARKVSLHFAACGVLSAALAGCTGGPSIGPANPAGPGGGATATPAPGATPTPMQTSGANASTPASCASGSTPAPFPAGGTLGSGTWIAAWGATFGGSSSAPANGSVRNIIRPSLGGTALRIRLSNPDASTPLVLCAAYVAQQMGTTGAQVVAGTTRQLTFNGNPGVTLPPKTDFVYSDPQAYAVTAHQNLAISLYFTNTTVPADDTVTWSSSYATAANAGDATRDESGASFGTDLAGSTSTTVGGFLQGGKGYALSAVDVLTTEANGAMVAFGSSTFQGDESDLDKYDDVAEDLANRVTNEIPYGLRKGMVNEGHGGDSLYLGLSRMQRDIFSQSGVSGAIIYDINDISANRTLQQIETDYRTTVAIGHAHGIRVFCPTWAPDATQGNGEPTQEREQLNQWILNSGTCDGVVDWDAILRDPTVPYTFNPVYFSDSIHPNTAGHAAIANGTPLNAWFTGYAAPPYNLRP